MSKLQLPTTGQLNWGSGLNAYIRHLENRIQTLEKNYGDQTISDVVQNVAGACTGVISNFECEYNDDTSTIKFSGIVYYAGDIRKIIEIKESQKIESPVTSSYNSSRNSYFVFLKYDSTISGDEIDKLEIVLEKELKLSYGKILIGFYFNRQFVPYFYWDMKTILQHHYELTHLYNDLDENALTISINSNQINTVDIGPATCNIYCGGIGYSSVDAPDIYTVEDNQPYLLTIKESSSAPLSFFTDEADDDGLIITSAPSSTAPSGNTADLHNGNYYRILLDIFGNTYIQKAAKDGYIKLKDYGAEQSLLNVRFGREFFDDEGYTYSLRANLFMEVGRFAYNGSSSSPLNVTYSNTVSGNLEYPKDILYTHSIRDGVAGQPYLGVWDIKQGHLFLDALKFNKTSESSAYDFSINYSEVTTLKDLSVGKIAENFLVDDPTLNGLEKVDVETMGSNTIFKYLLFQGSIGSFDFIFSGNDHTISLMGGCTSCEAPFTEASWSSCIYKGRGYDFKLDLTNTKNYIEVKCSITDAGGTDTDKKHDLEAISGLRITKVRAKDELYLTLDPTTSLTSSPKFLWTQTSSNEAIQLVTNNSKLIMPHSGTQPILLSGKGLMLKENDRTILNSSLDGGTVLNLYPTTDSSYRIEHKVLYDKNALGDTHVDYQINYHVLGSPTNFLRFQDTWLDDGGSATHHTEMDLKAKKINVDGTIYMSEEDQILFVSDARRKENFETINQSYLDVVQKVPVLKYNYRNSSKNQVGIMAQDLETALNNYRECFINIQDTTELQNQRSLNENKLVFILWKALQEEIQLRNKLEQRLEQLEKNL